jgi:hypothetical protein
MQTPTVTRELAKRPDMPVHEQVGIARARPALLHFRVRHLEHEDERTCGRALVVTVHPNAGTELLVKPVVVAIDVRKDSAETEAERTCIRRRPLGAAVQPQSA